MEHLLVDKAEEAPENRTVAGILLLNGYRDVKLLPQIKETEKALRIRYFGKEYAEKHLTSNPDALFDNTFYEFKKSSIKQLTTRIGKAAKQSNTIFIRMTEPIQNNVLEFKINRQWNMDDRKNLEKIIVYNNGVLKTFKIK